MLLEFIESLECIITLCISLLSYHGGNPLVVLCLAARTLVEVEWQVPLTRSRAFYTLVNEWNVENINS
jgi:hypothetical protein